MWNQKLLAPGSDNKSNQENHTKENSSAPSINESKTPGMTLPIDNTTSVLEENMDHQSETPPETKQNNDNIEDSLDETNPKSDESDETIGHNDKETEEDELPAVPI